MALTDCNTDEVPDARGGKARHEFHQGLIPCEEGGSHVLNLGSWVEDMLANQIV